MGEYQNEGTLKTNCFTGGGSELSSCLKRAISQAEAMDFNVSFLMVSGVTLILKELKAAADRGATIRILCGNYLNITQPEALYLLRDALGAVLDLRFYAVPNQSFHPKAYFFSYPDYQEVFVGSSNLSKSALCTGIEWNYRLDSRVQPEDCDFFRNSFENLLTNFSTPIDDKVLRQYARNWIRPQLYRQIEETETEDEQPVNQLIVAEGGAVYDGARSAPRAELIPFPQPRGPQIEALYALKQFRLEELDKGLVVAATGIGKTFLAAFDTQGFNRILFVAHRQEILNQAQQTFRCVRSELTAGRFNGDQKDTKADIIFASVQSLGKRDVLNSGIFGPEDFDYIIIDEFHHAVANCYLNIIDYFRPRFLLGLTATPERLDNADVFALCDYNVVYEVRLREAINRGWLAPFRYYGIYDDLDYNQVDFKNGQYDEEQLAALASVNRRGELIVRHYQKYASSRALGFCINRRHALYMTDYFRKQGISCCAVLSGAVLADQQELVLDRETAVKKLKVGDLQVVFSVDMLSEGLDIPELDLVMFLRPTQSPTVFLQQLGRGLRKTRSKKYVNVLDFIGNYKKANLVPFFLTGEPQWAVGQGGYRLPTEEDYPEGCFIDFDFRLIDLFKKMARVQKKITDRVIDEFYRIQDEYGKRPLRMDMYIHLDAIIFQNIKSRSEINIFKDYLSFLNEIGEITAEENELLGTVAHEFLKNIEKTLMNKTYKMPTLLAFYNGGEMKLEVDDEDLYQSFKAFFAVKSNLIDLLRDEGSADAASWGKKEYLKKAKESPIKHLSDKSGDYFYQKEGWFCLIPELAAYLSNPAFVKHFKDIIDYRTKRFYKERLEKLETQA